MWFILKAGQGCGWRPRVLSEGNQAVRIEGVCPKLPSSSDHLAGLGLERPVAAFDLHLVNGQRL